jgi:hypothetical protein
MLGRHLLSGIDDKQGIKRKKKVSVIVFLTNLGPPGMDIDLFHMFSKSLW